MKKTNLPEAKQALVPGGWDGHQNQWTAACKKGWGSYTSSPFSMAGPLTETVLMGNLATRSYMLKEGNQYKGRKKLLWDGQNMRITNFEAANQFVQRSYRKY